MSGRPPRPPAATPDARAPRRLVPLLLVGVTALVYLQAVGFGFVRADDSDLIVGNAAFLAHPGNIPRAFAQSYFEVQGRPEARRTYYRPLVVTSFMLDARMGGVDPAPYHATNLVLHVVAVLLFHALLLALGASRPAAVVLALVFAVHPLNVQTVCWVPGRNDSLLAVFGLLAVLALARHASTERPAWLVLHVTAFAAALLTKESAAVLPAVFVLYAWLWRGAPRMVLGRPALWSAYAVVMIAWYGLRRAALSADPGGLSLLDQLRVVAGNSPDLLLYLGKALLPINLNTMPAVDAAGLLTGVLALGLFVWASARAADPRRAVFGGAWFVLFAAPGLVVPAMPAYEHRAYLPLMGLLIGLSQGSLARGGLGARRWRAAAALLVAAFAVLSARHAAVFADPVAFWESAATSRRFAPIAHVNLGQLAEERRQLDVAAAHYRQALAIDPRAPGAHNNLGVVLTKQGRAAEALPYFLTEIELHPSNADAQFNAGLYYRLSGEPDRAVPYWESALAADPYYFPALEELAAYYGDKGDAAQAEAYRARLRGHRP